MPKLTVVQLNVTDLEEAKDFYCNKVGLELAWGGPMIMFKHDYLIFVANEVKNVQKITDRDSAPTLLGFEVDDIAATMKDMKGKGVEFADDEPVEFLEGVYATFRDPFGNIHQLLELKNKEE